MMMIILSNNDDYDLVIEVGQLCKKPPRGKLDKNSLPNKDYVCRICGRFIRKLTFHSHHVAFSNLSVFRLKCCSCGEVIISNRLSELEARELERDRQKKGKTTKTR